MDPRSYNEEWVSFILVAEKCFCKKLIFFLVFEDILMC
jgi:hypothetical protein